MATKYKLQSDGRYRTKVWDGSYRNGKKHYIYLSSDKSSKDLEKKVSEYELKRLTGNNVVDSKEDIYSYAKRWLDTSKGLKELSTYRSYSGIVNTYLKELDGSDFSSFTYTVIQDLINQNKEHPRTCQLIKLTLKQIGESAESDKLLPRGTTDEVFKRVTLPKRPKPQKRPLYPEEIKAIKEAPLGEMEKAFVWTLFYTGMRKEEALALTKKDITDVIRINKAVGFSGNTPYLKTPKTDRGIRTIPMASELKKLLKQYLKHKASDDLLFTFSGNLMPESSYEVFWRRIKRTLIKYAPNSEYGFTDLTAHLFRHNFCTQMCYQSATEHTITTKKIAELLGDTEQMVIEVYSHIISEKENVKGSIENALKM